MLGVKTGKGWNLPLMALLDIYVIWIITSIPGLAISPIEGKLATIFPGTSHLAIQMITTAPSLAAIPFIFLGGALGTRFNNVKLLNWTCIIYAIAGALFLVANEMWQLIALSFICGIGAGIISPLSVVFVSNIFIGKYRTKQFGLTSAILNVALMFAVIATGYLAQINWRFPFIMYLIPIIPVILTPFLKKYVNEPKDDPASRDKVKFKFSQQCDVKALIKYCLYYLFVTTALASISLYIPFLIKSSGTAGDLTSILFVGIMASGFILNWLIKKLKKGVYEIILIAMAVGFLLIFITKSPIIIGIGILIAAFFYGIAQPYCYDRCSVISTPVASTLTMAYLISMNSVGMILSPFIVSFMGKILRTSASTHPEFPYQFYFIIIVIAAGFVLFRRITRDKKNKTVIAANPVNTTSETTNDTPIAKAENKDVNDAPNSK